VNWERLEGEFLGVAHVQLHTRRDAATDHANSILLGSLGPVASLAHVG